jgi:hypothetical protein
MNDDSTVDFNSQEVSPDTLVSVDDDAGKYDVQIGEEGQYVEPADIPKETVKREVDFIPRTRTVLIQRSYTLMQAWGTLQMAWEDDSRITLVIAAKTNDINYSDNVNNLNAVGIASGVGVGTVYANTNITLVGFTGPLYVSSPTDSSPVSVTAVTVQK